MGNFVRVAGTGDIPPGEMIVVEVDGEEVAIANVGGEFFAFSNLCTHRGGPLGEGILTGDVVECPFHAGQFNVKTGAVVAPPPNEAVQTFPVKVDGDDISVDAS
jgi:nitrite reductase (NADH) small subunit/3-phenylpropionate/trans-cinnamate dioxygenase ferredoxin subunit